MHVGERDAVDAVFRKVELLTSIGQTIGSLEQLATSGQFADDGLFSWRIGKLRMLQSWPAAGDHLDRVFGYPNVMAMVHTRGLAGLGLILPGASRAQRGVLAATMCTTAYGLQTRVPYGFDGSDHFAFLNYACAALEKAFPHDERAREAVVTFLAAQACLSYFTSGAAKLFSPVWRDGSAIPRIFRTAVYGDSLFHRTVQNRPWLAKAVAWSTIAGEMAFPLALVAPKPVARGILAAGAAFHLGNARFMGLNRFVWSFGATYPAVVHVSRALGRDAKPAATRASNLAPLKSLVAAAARPGPTRHTVIAATGATVLAGATVHRMGKRRRERMRASAPGRLVRVDGRDVHVLANTDGEGPTVVFENGMACPATEWGWVLAKLGPGTNYVAYDRPGIGWSATASAPRDAERSSEGLHRLLAQLGARPPFLLVGHSVGGVLIRCFARRHPELVAGLVFVDSSHPDQLRRSPGQRQSLPWVRQQVTTSWLKAMTGTLRRSEEYRPFSALPDDMAEATERCMAAPGAWWATRQEMHHWQHSWSPDAARLSAISRPVAVLTAGETVRADPAHAALQRELAALSTVSRHDVVTDAGHNALVMAPEHAPGVVESIEWVRARANGFVDDFDDFDA
ncbi:alpha/beta fold hydrolase [Streptomyces sp. NPDC048636]|uniref:alpha/beta fold hydrolase n=1 Tax=Streptomyces sp. NPDC048636 TaxID=3155762 RepID=UPI003420EC91